MQKPQRFFPMIGAVLGLCLAGCSSDNTPDDGTAGRGGSAGSGSGGTGGSGAGDGGCVPFNYTNYMATTAPTLKKDIQPVLMRACSLASSCHQTGSTHPPVLGPSLFTAPDSGIDATILQGIMTELAKPSKQVTTKKFVEPGKPEDSYLVNKIDGTHECFVCTGPDKCGKRMPDGNPMGLEASEIKMFRDWIKNGAPM